MSSLHQVAFVSSPNHNKSAGRGGWLFLQAAACRFGDLLVQGVARRGRPPSHHLGRLLLRIKWGFGRMIIDEVVVIAEAARYPELFGRDTRRS